MGWSHQGFRLVSGLDVCLLPISHGQLPRSTEAEGESPFRSRVAFERSLHAQASSFYMKTVAIDAMPHTAPNTPSKMPHSARRIET